MRSRLFAGVGLAAVLGLVLAGGIRLCLAQAPAQPYPNYPFGASQQSNPIMEHIGGFGTKNGAPDTSEYIPGASINADCMVNKEAGEWMVCVASYKGKRAHVMARKLVSVLRDPKGEYKLWAYVFDYTSDARKKQEEEIQQKIAQYKQLLKLTGQTKAAPFRVHRFNIEDQVAVLVGGYKSKEIARKALDQIKEMPMPDKNKVEMDRVWVFPKDGKKAKQVLVNPLEKGFVVRNPTWPKEAPEPQYDIAALKRLNAAEEFSLLKCPKKLTLAIKEFRLPTYFEKDQAPSLEAKKTIFGQSLERTDVAAHNAHNLAAWLRDQCKLDAYVLHTKTSSVVTVGAFDDLDSAGILTAQQRIKSVHEHLTERAQQQPLIFQQLQIFPVGLPMVVPR